jgi:predicted nucleotidyltransferase component of viral defense system
MLDLKQIETFYPQPLRPFRRNLLREYLQYKILEIIFESKYSSRLAFMGGTAARIIHANTRFSEDLDFDNLGLEIDDFDDLSLIIQKKLKLQGYNLEIKNIFKAAFRSYIRFSDLLYDNKISKHRREKLLIQVDTEPQNFEYEPQNVILNKFDVFLRIRVVPQNILLSQKIYCLFSRPRHMGRDFYDTVFFMGRTKPDMDYLFLKLNIKIETELRDRLLNLCENLNFKQLARDVEPFLFNPSDSKKVLLFPEYIRAYEF